MNNNYILLALVFTFSGLLKTSAQSMNSPYSIYGIGDLETQALNRSSGMGGTGLALLSDPDQVVNKNVASLTGLERSYYVINLNLAGRFSNYSGTPINATNSNNRDLWIKEASLHIKMNANWASGVGLKPYSRVSYNLTGSRFIEGTTTSYATYYTGEGGLNEYYWSNAFSIGKHFSIGMKTSLLAGAINRDETLAENPLATTVVTRQQDYYSNGKFEWGALYKGRLGKKWEGALGARFSPQTRLASERTLTVEENGVVIVEDELLQRDQFFLPATVGVGVSFTKNKNRTFAIDYDYQDWSSLNIKGLNWRYQSSHRVSAGFETRTSSNKFGKLLSGKFFQIGAFYDNAALVVRNQNIAEYGVTMGYGRQWRNRLGFALSATAGVRGTETNDLIRESYFQIGVSFSYRDFIFSKGRKYY